MGKILGCNVDPEALRHCSFDINLARMELFSCLSPENPIPGRCAKDNPKQRICSGSLDDRLKKECHLKAAAARKCFNHQNVTMCGPELEPYMSRLKRYPDISKVRHCIRNINDKCRQKRITATKVIRMTMQSAEAVIRKIPDIHIVYYVRDPRGIFQSRHGGQFKELCNTMQADHKDYLILKIKFPEILRDMKICL